VVVGSQSSGKSSVLESIVGHDFLPRGTGICTRRPLILQLHHEDVETYAKFAHIDKRFFSFEEVRRTIEIETDKVAGSNKAVSREPLILGVHSKSVPNLTLVDLPGLTKVPVGDQPQNISEQIRTMVLETIRNPNCIILAVSAANQDIANSDGLQIAREVDPDGLRTLGVLTKLDLMDQGTDAREVLGGKLYPLRLGYIAVVNRSQDAINNKLSMQEALNAEETFFANHPAYSALAREQGIPFLSHRLNQILEDHIRPQMPEIRKKIDCMLSKAREEQERYGGDCGQTQREQSSIVVSAIHRFCEAYREIMSGKGRNSTKELYGPARIREIFTKNFRREIESMNSSELTDSEIHMARLNAVGINTDLFPPNAAFEVLMKKLIQKMKDPATRCVHLVREELKQVLEDVTSSCNEIGRFQELKEKVDQECMRLLSAKTKEAGKFVTDIVDMERRLISENPSFDKFRSGVHTPQSVAAHHSNIEQSARGLINWTTALSNAGRQVAADAVQCDGAGAGQLNEWEKSETEKLRQHVESSFKIVRGSITASVPKAILLKLVDSLSNDLHQHLMRSIHDTDDEVLADLTRESPEFSRKRKESQERVTVLERAFQVTHSPGGETSKKQRRS